MRAAFWQKLGVLVFEVVNVLCKAIMPFYAAIKVASFSFHNTKKYLNLCVYGVLISSKQQIHRYYQAQIALEEPKTASIT